MLMVWLNETQLMLISLLNSSFSVDETTQGQSHTTLTLFS